MKIYEKLFKMKSEIGKISKDSTNPFFKSKYFDVNSLLEHVEPIAQKNDLLILQPVLGGSVITQIIDIQTGEMVKSEIQMTNLNDAQKRGSEITYYRRYTLQSLLGLQAEDDDANKASNKTIKINNAELAIRLTNCKTLAELQNAYLSMTQSEQLAMVKIKDNLKTKLK